MMKSKLFMAGILVLALVFGLFVTGCDDEGSGSSSGNNSEFNMSIWEQIKDASWEKDTQRIVFTSLSDSSEWIGGISCNFGAGAGAVGTAITYLSDNKIHFGGESVYPFKGSYSFNFIISGNSLTVTNWLLSSNASEDVIEWSKKGNMNGIYFKKELR